MEGRLDTARPKLYKARSTRPFPLTDDKILVAWNGLMISAFARVGLATSNPEYVARGARAADFLLRTMVVGGQLRRVYKDGESSHLAVLTDHAFFVAALLDLYEASHEPRWLRSALELQRIQDSGFWDAGAGGYFMSHKDVADLMTREKKDYDGAIPAGNSVALQNLLRLEEFTGRESIGKKVEMGLAAFGATLGRRIVSMPRMGAALDTYLDQPKEIVIVKPSRESDVRPLLDVLGATYLPSRILVVTTEGQDLEGLKPLVPLVEGKVAMGGKVTAYVCQDRVCKRPTSDPRVFGRQLAEVSPYKGGPFEALERR